MIFWIIEMRKPELLDIIRLSYLAGINDTQEDNPRWCNQGSMERAEELLQEFEDSGDLTEELEP